MNIPEDEKMKPKLKAAVSNPERTVPGRIGTPTPKVNPTRTTQPKSKPTMPFGGNRQTPEDDGLDPRKRAILKRLRMKRNAQSKEEAAN
jgi:hypothetical protein